VSRSTAHRARLLTRVLGSLAALAASCVTTACGATEDGDVSAVAEGFSTAVGDGDGEAACGMLSSEVRTELEQSTGVACPEAILDEGLSSISPVESSRVYGTMAIVQGDGDTMFLSRFPSGWRVIAAGCVRTRQADQYDCSVSGG
jgi:hypothetical protein